MTAIPLEVPVLQVTSSWSQDILVVFGEVVAGVSPGSCTGIGSMWDSRRSSIQKGSLFASHQVRQVQRYCPSRIEGGGVAVTRQEAILLVQKKQSQKWLAWSRTSPNQIGANAIQPVWSGWSRKSLAIVLIIKTIAIAKGQGKRDQAPARSILPESELSHTPLEGSGINIIFNLVWARAWRGVMFRRRFNHGGAPGTLKRTTIESHRKREPCELPLKQKFSRIPDSHERIMEFLLFSSWKTCNFPNFSRKLKKKWESEIRILIDTHLLYH